MTEDWAVPDVQKTRALRAMARACPEADGDRAAPAPDAERPAATLYFTADDIDAALRTIRGEVTREESIVMAAAGAAASALRTGRRIVSMEARNAR